MGYVEIIRVNPDELDTCDQCNQKGLKTSGRLITDSHGEAVIWICFNCKQNYKG